MSYLQNGPWTSSEKVLHEKGIYPKWNDTPLPAGRSLAASQIIYEEMGRPFKQQGPYNVQPVSVSHVPPIAPAMPGRRPFPEYEPFAPQQPPQPPQQQRTLQPRPPRSTDSPIPTVTNGEASGVIRSTMLPEPAHEPQRKKRGRPSKEEAEERDRALAAEGRVYQPKKRPPKKARPSLDAPGPSRVGNHSPLTLQTPPPRNAEAQEESSSMQRRIKRPQSEEEQSFEEHGEERTESVPPGAQSPSDRLLATHRERDLDMLLTKEPPPKLLLDVEPKAEEKEH